MALVSVVSDELPAASCVPVALKASARSCRKTCSLMRVVFESVTFNDWLNSSWRCHIEYDIPKAVRT